MNLNCDSIMLFTFLRRRRESSFGLVQEFLGGDVMNPVTGSLPGRPRLLRAAWGSEHPVHGHLDGQGAQQSGHLARRTTIQERPHGWWCRNHHPGVDLSDVIDEGVIRDL